MSVPLTSLTSGKAINFNARRVTIAGFTGRDQTHVRAHVEELAQLGVPAPSETPEFYDVPPSLLTTADQIVVDGTFTSGEVEPVVLNHDGELWLAVGSDHTDRDRERDGIAVAKQACPKIISQHTLPLSVVPQWDDVRLTSWVDHQRDTYQSGTLAELLSFDDLRARLRDRGRALQPGDVLFLGTVPTPSGLYAGTHFAARLDDPATGLSLELSYNVHVRKVRADG